MSCHDLPLLSSIFISQQHKPISWPEAKSSLCCAVLSCSVVSNSLRPHGLESARLLCPWGFSSQEYWSGLPCPPPGDLPNPGIKPASPATSALQVDSLPLSHQGSLNNYIPSAQFNNCYFVMFVLFLSDIILYGVVFDIVWLYCTI